MTAPVLAVRGTTAWLLGLVSLIGIAAYGWPLFASASSSAARAHASDAPWLLTILVPLMLLVVLADMSRGRLDAKGVAVLGVVVAAGALLRLPTGGITGFSLMFFLMIPAGRVFGPGFGFAAGALTMFGSGLITAGVGPWLPFQMLGAGWIGMGAGLLPRRVRGRPELAMLAGYGAFCGFAYGLLLNLWFWPFATTNTELGYVPGDGLGPNLGRFWAFHLATSLGFDVPRALGNAVLMWFGAAPVMAALRRTARRAAFGAVATFADVAEGETSPHGDPIDR